MSVRWSFWSDPSHFTASWGSTFHFYRKCALIRTHGRANTCLLFDSENSAIVVSVLVLQRKTFRRFCGFTYLPFDWLKWDDESTNLQRSATVVIRSFSVVFLGPSLNYENSFVMNKSESPHPDENIASILCCSNCCAGFCVGNVPLLYDAWETVSCVRSLP